MFLFIFGAYLIVFISLATLCATSFTKYIKNKKIISSTQNEAKN